ncbi:MAG: hypothetical protein MUE73_11905 [Planctomycetes bacterium]|jgi:beta-glucosidase-like glycosyl hydrolase|nr:hypothetical protein [Planctomycetota bacterium]
MASGAGKDLPLTEVGGLFVPAIRLPRDYGRTDEFVRLARVGGVAGFIVFGGDRELTPPFLRHLREAAGRPMLLMADYERGAGNQVEGMLELPPLMALGASRSPEAAYMAGKITALSARAMGVNCVLAPVLDVLSRPENPIIGTRAISDDPDLVTRIGLAFIEGVQEEGVLACAKHFPGHGDTERDSHTALPVVTATIDVLRARELPPFREAVRAGVRMLMTAHVVYEALDPGVPATYSPRILRDLLRREWGFGGLVITDALTMEGARLEGADPGAEALKAGADLLLYPPDPWAAIADLRAAVALGRVAGETLAESRARVALVTGDLAGEAPLRRELGAEYEYAALDMARRSLTVLRDGDGLLRRAAAGPGEVLGLVLDDDGVPERARAFDPAKPWCRAGVVQVTPEGTGVLSGLAGAIRQADLVVMGLFGDVRMAKERAGLCPALRGFASEVLAEHAAKTLVVVFGNPVLLAGLAARNVVLAWGDAEVCRRSALEAIFGGGTMPGRLPLGPGAAGGS